MKAPATDTKAKTKPATGKTGTETTRTGAKAGAKTSTKTSTKPGAKTGTTTSAKTGTRTAKPRSTQKAGPGLTPERLHQLIAEEAYLRAERRGFAGGDPVSDWLAAEQSVTHRLTQGLGPQSRD
jgi:hypothetical protein